MQVSSFQSNESEKQYAYTINKQTLTITHGTLIRAIKFSIDYSNNQSSIHFTIFHFIPIFHLTMMWYFVRRFGKWRYIISMAKPSST